MDLQQTTDEQLAVLVREKDQELYNEIVKRYQDKLLRYARRLTNNSPDSEDIVQDSFIKAYKNLFAFNEKQKFSSWIFRITHNEAINALKKHHREVLVGDRHFLFELRHESKTISDTMDEKLLHQKMRNNIDKLPIKYKDVLVLFFLEEKSYEEISDILRLPMGTIATRINRGKKVLKNICIKDGMSHGKR